MGRTDIDLLVSPQISGPSYLTADNTPSWRMYMMTQRALCLVEPVCSIL